MSLLQINALTFSYLPNSDLFTNFSATFSGGEFVAIIGKNGAGKTTLAKLIIGMLKLQSGDVLVDGKSIKDKQIADIAEQIGFVFQNPNIMLFTNTVEKELELSLLRFNLSKEEINERINFMIDFFSLEKYRKIHPRLLSRGEKQKLALATVLIQKPKVIILDEPFSGIDATQKIMIRNYLSKLKEEGKLVIIITHDLESVLEYTDRVIALKSGKIIFDGETIDFFTNPKNISSIELTENPMLSLVYSLRNSGLPDKILRKDEIVSYFKKRLIK